MNSDTNNLPDSRLADLISKSKSGDETSLAELYKLYFDKIYRFIYYRVSHKETAEDLTEEVFIKSFKGIKSLEQPTAFEGWLYRIARNAVIDHYRTQKQVVALDEVENTLEYDGNLFDFVNLQSQQQVLIKLLAELTPEQQTVIKMKFVEDLDNATIAAILKKNEGAVRVIQHRAIQKLKELIKALEE